MNEPDPGLLLWNVMRGAMATKALALVADAGVADALADRPRPVAELARETATDADTLYRILRALATDGVFAEEEPGVFRHTPASERLRRGAPSASHESAHLFGGIFWRAIARLDARTGAPTVDFWTWLAEHPEEGAIFNRAMAGGASWKVEPLLELDWRDRETVVDLGGGNGAVLIELLRRRPGLRGIVFDLPEPAREAEANIAAAGLGDRCAAVAGSFFERVPAGDTYHLSAILHDWDDERAATILRVIRAAAPARARVLIRDAVLPPGNEPHGNKWLDLLMLAIGGRERTAEEWERLLAGAGFRPVRLDDGQILAVAR
ncbi:MAG: methyltransferase [Thermoleophilia bacterium]|nr:methyltransferase [Thermoleophilia bacterium]